MAENGKPCVHDHQCASNYCDEQSYRCEVRGWTDPCALDGSCPGGYECHATVRRCLSAHYHTSKYSCGSYYDCTPDTFCNSTSRSCERRAVAKEKCSTASTTWKPCMRGLACGSAGVCEAACATDADCADVPGMSVACELPTGDGPGTCRYTAANTFSDGVDKRAVWPHECDQASKHTYMGLFIGTLALSLVLALALGLVLWRRRKPAGPQPGRVGMVYNAPPYAQAQSGYAPQYAQQTANSNAPQYAQQTANSNAPQYAQQTANSNAPPFAQQTEISNAPSFAQQPSDNPPPFPET